MQKITWQITTSRGQESWVNIENNNFPEQKFLENSTGVEKTWNVVDGLLKQ